MREIKSISKNPLVIGGIVIGGFVLFMILRGGGGSTEYVTQGPSEQMQMATLNASNQMQMAQLTTQANLQIAALQGQMHSNEQQANLAALTQQLNAQIAMTDLTSERQLLAMAQELSVQKELTLAQISSQDRMVAANLEAAKYAAENATAQLQINSNTQVQLAEMQSATMQQMMLSQTQVSLAQTDYASKVELARIDSINQQAARQASVEKKKSNNGLIGSIIGGAISLFSDVRLKENIEFVGYSDNGLPRYSFNIRGEKQGQIGFMAHDVFNNMPSAIAGFASDFAAVDYARL